MALGIVRASDHGAIWREADYDGLTGEVKKTPSTSTPPTGAPAPAVQIPNSNKFKTPANGLLKVLKGEQDDPYPGYEQTGSPALQEWLSKPQSQAFAKTYFKPQYNDALKAHLGDQAHAKLLNHLPPEHKNALTNYTQSPAPNSNKFKTPANSLKKLLENPHTTQEHLNQWVAKTPTNTSFAEKYLKNPAYQDALKGHLGEKSYQELQKHLNEGETKTQTPSLTSITTPDMGPTPSFQEMMDKAKKPLPKEKSLGQQLGDLFPGEFQPKVFDSFPPDLQKKNLQQWVQVKGDAGHPNAPALQKLYDQHFGDTKPPAEEPQDLNSAVLAINPKMVNFKHLSPQEQYQAVKSLAESHGDTPKGKQWADLLAKHFSKGGQPATPGVSTNPQLDTPNPQVAPAPTGDNPEQKAALVAGIKKIFPNSNIATNPDAFTVEQIQQQMQKWQDHLDHPDHQGAVAQLKDLHGQHFGPKGWSPNAPSPGQQQEPSGVAETPGGHPITPGGVTEDSLLKYFPHLKGNDDTIANWTHGGDQEAQKAHLLKTLDTIKSTQSQNFNPEKDVNYQKWQQLYQEAFGHEAPGHEKVHPAAQEWMDFNGTPEQNSGGLKYKDMTPGQVQKALQHVVDDKLGGEGYQLKAKELLDKHFGKSDDLEPADLGYGDEAYTKPEDEPGFKQWLQKASPSSYKLWDKDLGVTDEEKQDYLNQWGELPDEVKQKYQQPAKYPSSKEELAELVKHIGIKPMYQQDTIDALTKNLKNGPIGFNSMGEYLEQKYPQALKKWQGQQSTPTGGSDFVTDFKKAFPGATGDADMSAKTPEQQKAKMQELLDFYKPGGQYDDPEHYQALRELMHKHFDDPDEIKAIQQQMGGDPWGSDAPGMTPTQLGPKKLNGDQLVQDLANVWGIQPSSAWPSQVDQALSSGDEAKAKELVEDKLKEWQNGWDEHHKEITKKLQGVYDKHFGDDGPDFELNSDDWDEPDGTPSAWDPIKPKAADPHSLTPSTPEDKELFSKVWKNQGLGDGSLQSWLAMSPESWKENISTLESPGGWGNKGVQAAWNKYKELKAQQGPILDTPTGVTFDQIKDALLAHPGTGWKWDGGGPESSGGLNDLYKLKDDPAAMKAKLEEFANNKAYAPSHEPAQAALDKLFGGDQQSTPTQPTYDWEQLKKDYAAVYGKAPDSTTLAGSFHGDSDPAKVKQWLQTKAVNFAQSGFGDKKEKAKKLQALIEKHFGGGALDKPLSHTDLINKLIADGTISDTGLGKTIASWSPKDFKDSVDVILKNKMPGKANSWWNSDGTPKDTWGHIAEAWEKQGKGGAAPAPKPAFDWSQFGPEFKAVFPNSGWAQGSDPGEESAKSKLKDQLASAIANYPGTEKTQKAQALWDKWFGDGSTSSAPSAPTGGGAALSQSELAQQLVNSGVLDSTFASKSEETLKTNIGVVLTMKNNSTHWKKDGTPVSNWAKLADAWEKQQAGQLVPSIQIAHPPAEPDEYEGVSAPAKSEKPKAADVKQWAANKPASPADWKNFAAYWGKTKLSPKQEQAIYQAWFNKETTPESASSWFAKVYDYHSKPSTGDLGAEGMPSWASASWALGDKAKDEWPVFQQWATKDQGIPKDLGIKGKLAIWNSLSQGDKKEISENYLPKNPIDTKAVVQQLQEAFPDSDFSQWANLGQGSLKTSVETLAKSGYPEAIPIFNQYFGGKIPMPEPKAEGEQTEPTGPVKAFKPVPVSQLPDWVENHGGGKNEAGALKYSSQQHWADTIGAGDWFKTGVPPVNAQDGNQGIPGIKASYYDKSYKYPYSLIQQYDQYPQYIKDAVDAIPAGSAPWNDYAGFQEWAKQQPQPVTEVSAIYGGQLPPALENSYAWQPGAWGYSSNQKLSLGKQIENEADPVKKAALLGVYHKYFMGGKETLGQALEKIYPAPPTKGKDAAPNWETYLKTHSTDDTAKLVKKMLKAEGDPDRFVMLADAWAKYFPHPNNSSDVAPSGIKQLTDILKSQYPGNPISADNLKSLHHWKANGGTSSYLKSSYYLQDYDPGDYIKNKADKGEDSGYAPYHGWTPPGAATGTFKADPAMLMAPQPSYQAPAEGPKGKYVQTLLDTVNAHKVSYSAQEQALMGSEEFQSWFNNAPTGYKQVFQHNPGIALEDFKEFMGGGMPYGEVPGGEGATSTTDKYYDVTPFANLPKPGKGINKKKLPTNITHNPPREPNGKPVKFPHYEDEQETLPLAPGEHWAPKYAPMPIYRLFPLSLSADDLHAPNFVPEKDRPLWEEQQRARLRKIDEIINGTPQARNPKSDKAYFDKFVMKKGLSPEDAKNLQQVLFTSEQLQLGTDEQWKHFDEFSKKMKAKGINLPKEDIADLAMNLGITPPLSAKGNYDHPDLANLILDFVEGNRGWGEGESDYEPRQWGGLGTHWTRDKDKLYEGVGGVQSNPKSMAHKGQIPIMLSGLWGGQGEGKGEHGAYNVWNDSEREHNLYSGAPVHIRRLQIADPNGDYHDLIDPGPMSLWSPGRDETATNKKVTDKPSLAVELQKVLGTKQDAEYFDKLKPGAQADVVFAKLVHEHPGQKKELLKLYRDFFVGKPHLTTKPHVRRASVGSLPVEAVESQIERLADLVNNDVRKVDPKFDQRPEFYDKSNLQLKRYYSPHEMNPAIEGGDRDEIHWGGHGDTDDYLGGEDWQYFDRGTLPLHRGLMLDLRHPSLAPLRRALLGPEGEDHGVHLGPRPQEGLFDQHKTDIKANPAGYDNRSLGHQILEHLSNSDEWKNEIHSQGGLGPHWSLSENVANTFAGQPASKWHLPVKIKADWKGLGEDPYRSATGGSFPEENEVTMLPGANMNISSVQIKHPVTKKWHEVLDQGEPRMAATVYHRTDREGGPFSGYVYTAKDPYSVGHETRAYGDHITQADVPDEELKQDSWQPRRSTQGERWFTVDKSHGSQFVPVKRGGITRAADRVAFFQEEF